MNTPFDASTLLPGDHLLYRPSGIVGWIIAVKTWARISHIEIYVGGNMSVASRDGIGVNKYQLRTAQLASVLRPIEALSPVAAFDLNRASQWFDAKAQGQKYDFLGLLCFTLAAKRGSPNRMFCSEFAKRWDVEAGIPSFALNWDADRTAPDNFLMSPAFEEVWSDGKPV